jgi:glutathione S-transferase
MALAHKGLEATSIPWRFTEKSMLAAHGSQRVPVLLHNESAVVDSWAIANYLEDNFPDRPSLFGGAGGRSMSRLINAWGDIAVVGGIFPMVAADIHSLLDPADADYFRSSREARLGRTLEEVVAQRDRTIVSFRKSLEPMRQTLKAQPYIGGATPNYADYIVFGGFQWARVVSPFHLLEAGDPIYGWREKLLDALDGLARKSPGHPV